MIRFGAGQFVIAALACTATTLSAQYIDEFDTSKVTGQVAMVGTEKLMTEYVSLLEQLPSYYPFRMGAPVPMQRPVKINFVETELLYQDARKKHPALVDSIRKDRQFAWVKRAISAEHYYRNGLRDYFGYPRARLEEIYARDPARYDLPVDGKGFMNKMSAHNIAFEIFIKEYPPDTARMRRALPDSVAGLIFHTDPEKLNNAWAVYVSVRAANEFFTEKFFQDKYLKPLPQDLASIVDKKEYGITAADVAMVGQWKGAGMPTQELVRTLLRWKLFDEHATQFSDNMFSDLAVLHNLALKYEVAYIHSRRHLVTQASAVKVADKSLIDLAYTLFATVQKRTDLLADSTARKDYQTTFKSAHQTPAMLKRLAGIRDTIGVSLLDPEIRNAWWVAPGTLIARGDSLAGAGKTDEAIKSLESYVRDYPYHKGFADVSIRLSELRGAASDSVSVNESFRALYNAMLMVTAPGDAEKIVRRCLVLCNEKPAYVTVRTACEAWLKKRAGSGKR